MKYPVRYGSQKFWMQEAQVAAAYRHRHATAKDAGTRVQAVEESVRPWTAMGPRERPRPTLLVSLAPEMPGDFTITREELHRFQAELVGDPFILGRTGSGFFTAGSGVRSRRIFASGHLWGRVAWAELHTEGAGSVAMPVEAMTLSEHDTAVEDSQLVLYIMSALRFLARHAVERAGANGTAVVSARLLSDPDPHYLARETLTLLADDKATVGRNPVMEASGDTVVFLDDLAVDGQPLTAAVAGLTAPVLQAFGVAEARQIRLDGTLELKTWGSHREALRTWAARCGIPVEETEAGA